jgi:hypothetical protein
MGWLKVTETVPVVATPTEPAAGVSAVIVGAERTVGAPNIDLRSTPLQPAAAMHSNAQAITAGTFKSLWNWFIGVALQYPRRAFSATADFYDIRAQYSVRKRT